MIRKLKSGEYRIYSRKKNPKTNKRRNLGTFGSLDAAQNMKKKFSISKDIDITNRIFHLSGSNKQDL
jgi:hypothetical protein